MLHTSKSVVLVVLILEIQVCSALGRLCVEPSVNSCFVSSAISTAPSSVNQSIKKDRGVAVVTSPSRNLDLPSNFVTRCSAAASSIPDLYSVDVRYNRRSPLNYDPSSGRYLDNVTTEQSPSKIDDNGDKINGVSQFLQRAFVPEGVTPSYYQFMRWRILQRFINANVHVIGTQSLLMGLRGMHRGPGGVGAAAVGAAAATNWVLKDTLGKIVRMGES
jgi:hypothetical protein